MNFDQWIDSVNDQVHARLGREVRTEELSWDSAHWVSAAGNVVASLDTSESGATISFDNGEKTVGRLPAAAGFAGNRRRGDRPAPSLSARPISTS